MPNNTTFLHISKPHSVTPPPKRKYKQSQPFRLFQTNYKRPQTSHKISPSSFQPEHQHVSTMTSQDEVSFLRKLQRLKRRLLLEYANDFPTQMVGVEEQPPRAPLRVRGMSGASDSYEEVSMARKLQRMKRRLLLDHGGICPHAPSLLSMNGVVLVEAAPSSPKKPKSHMEASYLAKSGFSPLERKGLHDIPHTLIQIANMA